MSVYPVPFDHAAFPRIPVAVIAPKDDNEPSTRTVKTPVMAQSALRITAKPDAFVTALWIQGRSDWQALRLLSKQGPEADGPADGPTHFHFLPGMDEVEIRWTVVNPKRAVKARFEIWAATDDKKEIWSKEYSGEQAVDTLTGKDRQGDGPLAWREVVIAGDEIRFPDQCPNAAFGPYQLRLTVTSKRGSVTTAWTYFDILVERIELQYGPRWRIPKGPIKDVLPLYQTKTADDEKELVTALQANGAAVPAEGVIPLPLKSTQAAYVHFNEWFCWRDLSFLRHKARWGDGPRIPLFAKVFLKDIDEYVPTQLVRRQGAGTGEVSMGLARCDGAAAETRFKCSACPGKELCNARLKVSGEHSG